VNFAFFCSCDLDLDPMTFMYELDRYFLKIYSCSKMNLKLLTRRFADGDMELLSCLLCFCAPDTSVICSRIGQRCKLLIAEMRSSE